MKQMSSWLLLLLAWNCIGAALPPWLPELPEANPPAKVSGVADIPDGPAAAPAAAKQVTSLNGEWKCGAAENSPTPFPDDFDLAKGYAAPELDESGWNGISVPRKNVYRQYPKLVDVRRPYLKVWYRRTFNLTPKELASRRVILKFDRVAYEAAVFVNGRRVGVHKGAFTPFEFDITDAVKPGMNVLAVRCRCDLGRDGGIGSVSHVYGAGWVTEHNQLGILGSVTLSLEPEMRIDKMFITPLLAESAVEAELVLDNRTGKTVSASLDCRVTPAMRGEEKLLTGAAKDVSVELPPGISRVRVKIPLERPELWSVDRPYLYFLTADVKAGGALLSRDSIRFGYREFRTRDGKFFLNGEPVYLFGAFLHSLTFPALDPWHRTKFEQYKKEGANIARTLHDPLLPEALDAADETGFLLFHEWAWSFYSDLDFEQFEANNLAEVEEFVEYSHNHPSVVMWSLGNEIGHRDPRVARQLNLQAGLVRRLDRQQRPVSAFSGDANWDTYGDSKLDTDLFDFHDYSGLKLSWTRFLKHREMQYEGLRKIYGDDAFSRPSSSWETIGFGWGTGEDKEFRRGNLSDYAAYMSKPASEENPGGIGFLGSAPLFKILQPGFGLWANGYYGHRILELIRTDSRQQGFCSWIQSNPMSALWTQPVYVSLQTAEGLFPRNLFSGESGAWNLFAVNDSPEDLKDAKLELTLVSADGKSVPAGTVEIGEVAAHSRFRGSATVAVPELAPGHYQMRLSLRDGEREASRNFYDCFVAGRGVPRLAPARPVYLLDTGAPGNLAALRNVLAEYGVTAKTVKSAAEIQGPATLVVPPELTEEQMLSLADGPVVDFVRNGGVLLVPEQKNPKSLMPGGLHVTESGRPFVDQVLPDHPVFRGLDWTEFDTWQNADSGFVTSNVYLQYMPNSLAVKGAGLGDSDIGTVLLEGTDGSGRILCSQFNAFASRDTDSAARAYLTNLLAYATGDEFRRDAMPIAAVESADYSPAADRSVPVDLKPYATTSFANDGKSGWTDQDENDFRSMPLGRQVAGGVPFEIIDPAKNGGKSCIVLQGSERRQFPAGVRGIRVGRKFSRMFFLHTAAWAYTGRSPGSYRFHYADGKSDTLKLECGVNIGDWWNVSALPEAKIGIVGTNTSGRKIGTYVAVWDNPHPDREIVSMDFLSAAEARGNGVDWLPGATPVPVLVAVTGETFSEQPMRLLDKDYRHAMGTAKAVDTPEGREIQTTLAKPDDAAVVLFNADVPADDYRVFSCRIKSDRPATLKIQLPEKKWQGRYIGLITVKGDNRFHTYRLLFGKDFTVAPPVTLRTLRGELWISEEGGEGLPPLNPAIRDVSLE